MILGIDPGLRAIGWALVEDNTGALRACGLARGALSGRGPAAWGAVVDAAVSDVRLYAAAHEATAASVRVVSEFPQVYAAGKSKGDPADLLELAAVVGMLAAALKAPRFSVVLPRAWKGNVPKDIMARRILAGVTGESLAAYNRDIARVPPYLRHNVIDAVGIAKWAAKKGARP